MMGTIIEQSFVLISSQAGTLLYQFILAFSIAGSLVSAISHTKRSDSRQVLRAILGLSLLLLLRFIVFIAAGMSLGGFLIEEAMLPFIGRVIDLVSLVIIIWLWALPDPDRLLDAVFVLLLLTITTLGLFGMISWVDYSQLAGFNGSLPDRISQLTALILVVYGLILLVFKRPNGWSIGFLMIAAIGAGHLIQLIFPLRGGDIAFPVRVAQMFAYPLLFLIPARFSKPVQVDTQGFDVEPAVLESESGDKIKLLDRDWSDEFLALMSATLPDEAQRRIARFVSELMEAEISLIVTQDPDLETLRVVCGYDRRTGSDLTGFTLYPQQFPLLVDAMKECGVARLPTSSAAPDISSLCQIYQLDRVGVILSSCERTNQPAHLLGIVLFSPTSDRNWTLEDQDRLAELTPPLAHFLHRIMLLASGQVDLIQARQELMLTRERERDLLVERQYLHDLLSQVEESVDAEGAAINLLAGLRYSKGTVQETVSRLQSDHQVLIRRIKLARELPPAGELTDLAARLDQASQEILFLRTALKGAEDTLLAVKAGSSFAKESEQDRSAIIAMIQELRRSTTIIQEYTSYILGGSLGDVSEVQRKMLHRIQEASSRLRDLTLDLARALNGGGGHLNGTYPAVDLSEVIRESFKVVHLELREKDLKLTLDLAEDLPPIHTHQGMVQSLVTALLRAGGDLSLGGGHLLLVISPVHDEKIDQAVKFQLTCRRRGMDQPLPGFHEVPQAAPIAAGGPASDKLTLLKSLAVDAGGRAWLDQGDGSDPVLIALISTGSAGNLLTTEVGDEG